MASLPVDDLETMLRAIKFAAKKHVNQRRKDARGTPYINHPVEVAELLVRVGKVTDLNILVAAILHDTVEDTDTEPADIEALFGKAVLTLVMECTDDKTLPKSERKRLQIESAGHKSAGAKLIKIADKICNVRDLGESPPPHWSTHQKEEYLDWTEQVMEGLRRQNQDLDHLYDSTLANARKSIADES